MLPALTPQEFVDKWRKADGRTSNCCTMAKLPARHREAVTGASPLRISCGGAFASLANRRSSTEGGSHE
jgi:hypothetical protein